MRFTQRGFCLLFLGACAPSTDLQKQSTTPASGQEAHAPKANEVAAGTLLDPPPGATDLPINLASIWVAFREKVVEDEAGRAFRLRNDSGTVIPLLLGKPLDAALATYPVNLSASLTPRTRYRVEVQPGELHYGDGKPVPAGFVGEFSTGAEADDYAPRVETASFEIQEGCLRVHAVADEPVRVIAELLAETLPFRMEIGTFALTHDWVRREANLPWGDLVWARVRLLDRAGHEAVSDGQSMLLPSPIPKVALVELLPNPAGTEGTQEWVEIYNFGPESVDLGGWILADKTGGDRLPVFALAPSARALIVPEAFDPNDPKDIGSKEGTSLIRVAGKLGGDGLSNAGEILRLLGSQGQIISQYGGYVNTSTSAWSGRSVLRKDPAGCDAVEAWTPAPQTPTPGF